jgi:hypothetical protein
MGGGKTTQTSENKIDPALMALYNQNYQRALQIADTPFQPYTGERVAGFTPTQTQAHQMVGDIATGRTGADTLDRAKAGYDSLMNYAPAQIAAPGAVQAGEVGASPITAGMLRDTDLSAYMNPYTQNVIDTSLADLSRARDIQRVADNQAATRANAFGGSRQGVADSLTNEAYLRNVASTSANLRNAGYDKAVSAAIADLDRALGANQFNSGQAYDAQKTNVANRLNADQFNAGMAFDVGRTNAANDLAGANFRLNAAGGLAGLSNQELNMALARAGALGAVGDMQQQNQQARDDAAYEEFMRMIGYPAQQQQLRNQALGMMPVQQTNTTTTKNNPGFLDYLNTAANVAGAFKGW